MLGDSAWGVCAESLVDTVTLQQDDVKWLDGNSKRPWLAGLVKDRKCALLDVESMIALLAEGASIKNSK
jgi:purine-binding chemotaxis protein CheW